METKPGKSATRPPSHGGRTVLLLACSAAGCGGGVTQMCPLCSCVAWVCPFPSWEQEVRRPLVEGDARRWLQ